MSVPEDTMANGPITYRWQCPLCGESKEGLSVSGEDTVEELVKNAMAGHVRLVGDDVHGPAGSFPPEFDPEEVRQYINLTEDEPVERRVQ